MLKGFNVNNSVLVKLTYDGIIHYHERYNRNLPHQLKKSLDDIKGKANNEGYFRFALWELMEFFGDETYMGCKLLFDAQILIKTKDLSEVSGINLAQP